MDLHEQILSQAKINANNELISAMEVKEKQIKALKDNFKLQEQNLLDRLDKENQKFVEQTSILEVHNLNLILEQIERLNRSRSSITKKA